MTKCEKCGHMNPYWLADFHDVEREYAKVDDIEGARALLVNVIIEQNGFAYKRTEKYIRRLPLEIYRARGKWGTPYKSSKYYDPAANSSGKFRKGHRRSHSSSQAQIMAYESLPGK
jgi:hypothetical protein